MIRARGLLKNWYVFSILSKIALVVIGLANSVMTSRYLGAELKGETAYISSIVTTAAIFTSLGLHQAYPYFRKKEGKEKLLSPYMTNVIALHAVYFIICITVCFIVKDIETKVVLLYIPISSYHRVCNYVAVVEKPNRIQFWNVVVEIFVILVVAIMMFIIPKSFAIAVFILVAVEIMMSIICTLYLHPKVLIEYLSIRELWKYGKYGFMPMISLLLSTMNYRVDTIMMKQMNCISTAQLGVYSIGIALAQKVLLIPEAVKTILLSKLSRGRGADEVAMAMRFCFPVALITCMAIVALGKPFVNLLYGGEYSGAYEVTIATMIGIISIMFYKMIATYNNVNNLQYLNVKYLSISVLVNIGMNAILLPTLNIIGGALASTISYTICAVLFIISFKKRTSINVRDMIILSKDDIRMIKRLVTRRRLSHENIRK